MRINELFDLDNPMGAVDDVLGGVSNLFKGKSKDNNTRSQSQRKQQSADNANWCSNPKNKKNPNYKKICR